MNAGAYWVAFYVWDTVTSAGLEDKAGLTEYVGFRPFAYNLPSLFGEEEYRSDYLVIIRQLYRRIVCIRADLIE